MAPKFQPKRVRSEEDRNRGRGQFIRLKNTNDQFMGYALFKPDPADDDNPGWYEFEQHYTPTTGYCPCFGENCPICEMGDNASDRAVAAFLVVNDEDDDISEGEIKLFEMNYYVIQEFVDYESDEGVMGKLFRLKRLEGNGKFAIRPKKQKLKAGDIKKQLASDDMPEIEKMLIKRMAAVAEELDVTEAMGADEDESDNSSEPTKARKGKAKSKPEPEPEESFDPDSADEFAGTVFVYKIVKSKNIATVETEGGTKFDVYGTDEVDLTEFSKDDTIYVEAQKDSDDDFVVSVATPEETPSEEKSVEFEPAGEEGEEFEGDEYDGEATVVNVDSGEETMEVSTSDGNFTLWFLDEGEDDNGNDWADFDVDDFSEGDVITIVAARDEDGDMLAGAFPEKAKKKAKGGKKKSKSKA